jgi:4'-phosphopantetheinyl transferase
MNAPSVQSAAVADSASPFEEPTVPPLADGEVVVWQAALDGPSPALVDYFETLLSADERERASNFFFARDRRRFVVGRGILRSILGGYAGAAPRTLTFEYNAHGKPALRAGDDDLLQFNVAHSGELALFAFTRGAAGGVDVEQLRDLTDWPHIAELSFPPEELARVQAADEVTRPLEFFRAWTRQEALLKAYGVGLGAPAVNDGTFTVYPLEPAVGYAAAVAIDREARALVTQAWLAGATPGRFHAAERIRHESPNLFSPQRG